MKMRGYPGGVRPPMPPQAAPPEPPIEIRRATYFEQLLKIARQIDELTSISVQAESLIEETTARSFWGRLFSRPLTLPQMARVDSLALVQRTAHEARRAQLDLLAWTRKHEPREEAPSDENE